MESIETGTVLILAFGLALLSLSLLCVIAASANKDDGHSFSWPFLKWWRRTTGAEIDYAEKPTEAAIEVLKEPDIPDGWFTSLELFELEKRSIFSTTWLLTTHISHFRKPGDYRAFNIASYAIFLILGKDGVLRGFHNVCRHRAYTVTRKTAGSTLVLGCKYHGWSYDTKGALVKAPHFENIPGFDKASNSLFEVGVRTDQNGLVWVRLSGNTEGDSPEGTASFPVEGISRCSSSLMTLESQGDVNWKFDIAEGDVVVACNRVERNPYSRIAGLRQGISLWSSNRSLEYPVEVYPNSALQEISSTPFSLLFSILPISPSRSLFRMEVLSSRHEQGLRAHEKAHLEQIKAQFEQQVRAVEERFKTTPLEDLKLHGTQKRMLSMVNAHLKLERQAGKKLYPVMPGQVKGDACGIADKLCEELEAGTRTGSSPSCGDRSLAW